MTAAEHPAPRQDPHGPPTVPQDRKRDIAALRASIGRLLRSQRGVRALVEAAWGDYRERSIWCDERRGRYDTWEGLAVDQSIREMLIVVLEERFAAERRRVRPRPKPRPAP